MSDPAGWSVDEGRPDRPIWVVVAIVATILMVLAVSSAISYSSIVFAQATVSIAPATNITFQGTQPNGSLGPDGSLSVGLRVRIENPSGRTLRLQLVAFSEWIEDGPAEAGMNDTRRIADALLLDANGSRYFYRLFGESKEVSGIGVPPRGNTTYASTFVLSRIVDPTRFAVLRNITNFWVSRSGRVAAVHWNSWVRLALVIEGVPVASSPTAAPFLGTIERIDRQEGLNLA
jgi:hypothetical protein